MGLLKRIKDSRPFDVIRCDETSYLIWKWHQDNSVVEKSQRENAIRWNSSLRVKEGEVAVFVYKQKNGLFYDYIEGPFDKMIKTANFPVLSEIIGLAYGGGSPFQAEVYFINMAKINQIKFGVPFFDIFDARYPEYSVPVAVRGTVSFQIREYREFIKLHRLIDFSLDDFQHQIRDAINRYVKDIVANAPAYHNIPLIQIETKTAQINDEVEYNLRDRLKEDFGVNVSGVDISAIEIDKSNIGYTQLMAVTKNITTATIEAQAAANIKNIHDKQRIEAENYEESLRIQREEGQYAQHMQTQSANIAAFQIEKQAAVGIAGAEALGHMGEHGAGNVDLGSNNGGFNPAAMMTGIALGGAVGQNIAGAMNGMMSGMTSILTPQTNTTPPPTPASAYHVAINGKATGPFDINAIRQMIFAGQFTLTSLVWKNGMENWMEAQTIDELRSLFNNSTPPAIPTE